MVFNFHLSDQIIETFDGQKVFLSGPTYRLKKQQQTNREEMGQRKFPFTFFDRVARPCRHVCYGVSRFQTSFSNVRGRPRRASCRVSETKRQNNLRVLTFKKKRAHGWLSPNYPSSRGSYNTLQTHSAGLFRREDCRIDQKIAVT